MYEKYFRDSLFLESHLIRDLNEVRKWEDAGMGGSFPNRRRRRGIKFGAGWTGKEDRLRSCMSQRGRLARLHKASWALVGKSHYTLSTVTSH